MKKAPIDFVMAGDLEEKVRLSQKFGYGTLGVFGTDDSAGPTCLLITDRDGNLGSMLRKNRRDADIVVVASSTKNRLLKAASDDRVDAILPDFSKVWLDDTLAGMVKRKGSTVLFAFSQLCQSEKCLDRIILLRRLSKALETVEAKNIPFILASLARSPLEMRAPMELSNLFSILGASGKNAKIAINDIPISIIERNIERRGNIAPGVKVIKT